MFKRIKDKENFIWQCYQEGYQCYEKVIKFYFNVQTKSSLVQLNL